MKQSLLHYLACPSCHSTSLKPHSFSPSPSEIIEGILLCASCTSWYLIEEGILELLTADFNYARKLQFYQHHTPHFKKLKLKIPQQHKKTLTIASKLHQGAFFDSFSEHYVLETQPFWIAYYHRSLQQFTKLIQPSSLILDVGCGNALSSLPLIRDGHTVVGHECHAFRHTQCYNFSGLRPKGRSPRLFDD